MTDPQGSHQPGSVESPALPSNLRWSVFKNTTSQGVGRLLIALSRLVIAAIIVRSFGTITFGEYSLIFGILAVAEWFADFGATEVFVREICQYPSRRSKLLRVVTAMKAIQIPAAYVVLLTILLAMRYPARIVEAGLVGGSAMVFFGGVLIYRVLFKATLTMEREIAAEVFSVLVMIPLIALASSSGAGLTILVGCHLVSRAAYFGATVFLGRRRFLPSTSGVTWEDVRGGLAASWVIGVIGFLVGVYEATDILMLSKLEFASVGYYAAAQRLVWPVLMALTAVATTLYPILASYWQRAPADFQHALQRGIDTVVVLAGLALCPLLAGAEFFMGLIGPDLVVGAPVLRILAVLCFVKAISSTVGPVLYVVRAQHAAFRFIAVAVVVKITVIAMVTPRFGYLGVAYGALGVELLFAALPAVLIVQRRAGLRIRWTVPIKTAVIAAVTGFAPQLVLPTGGLAAALVAPALYVPLVFFSGCANLSDVRSLLKRQRP